MKNLEMPSSSSDAPLKSIKIKPAENFTSRRLTREISMNFSSSSSSEVYYGDASGAVPFMWEIQPGTPKVKHFRNNPLIPPLTPPPSYLSSHATNNNNNISARRKPAKSNLLQNVLPKLTPRRSTQLMQNCSPTPSLSSSTSSSSSSSPWSRSAPSSPFTRPHSQRQQRFSSPRLSVDSRRRDHDEDDDINDEDDYGSPISTLCFGFGRSSNGRSRGCSSGKTIKLLFRDFA